ncbi:sodium:solute symporter [Spirochaetia bacterium]|nr:sodium:solute symporter [Spirochaetia bacterium]
MTPIHYLGAAVVILLITGVGIYAGRQVKSAKDFTTSGRKAGAGIVAGSIIGTLVGGASTIGTAQLAFSYGFSAWWFTLGGGLGCLALLFFVKPLYNSGISTLPQVFEKEYGVSCNTAATLLTSMGSFLSIVSQMLSGIALISSIVGFIPPVVSTVIIVFLMLAYVIFGGIWGAGLVGIVKTVLLYTATGICGVLAITLQGGISSFVNNVSLPAAKYFNLIARGPVVDLGAGLSLVLGVLTTQAYIQAAISARSLRESRKGVLISVILVPIIGIAGIFVGMYMKLNHPDIIPATAMPLFILEQTPPFLAGIILATLLVALVGTGSGLALGLGSMICNSIFRVKKANDKKYLLTMRLVIFAVFILAAAFSTGNLGSMILGWSFMSMGLRGAVAFGPLCAALFLPGRIGGKFALAAMITGPVLVLLGKFILPPSVDSLFLGIAGSFVILGIGLVKRRARGLRSQQ